MISGLLRHLAAGGHHLRRHLRIVAEGDAAFLDVRAGDVDLDGVDRRVIEAPRHLDVLLDGRAADVGDEARLAEVQLRQDVRHHLLDARVLQADRVQHAGGRLVDAVRRIAEPRLAGRALEHDGADVAVGEALDARVFLAEAHAAGEQHDRGGEIEAAELQGQERGIRRRQAGCARDWFERRHGAHYRTRPAGASEELCSTSSSSSPRSRPTPAT